MLTDTLAVLSSGCAGDRVSIDDLSDTLGSKCFAGLIFLLAAPNIFPTPPFVDVALSIPLIVLSAQLMLGARRPWLPRWIGRRRIATDRFAMMAKRICPVSRRLEKVLRRRLPALTGLAAHRFIGCLMLLLSMMLALPVPFGNAAPGAAIALFALGLLNRDGIPVIAGGFATVASAAIVAGFGYGAVQAAEWIARILS